MVVHTTGKLTNNLLIICKVSLIVGNMMERLSYAGYSYQLVILSTGLAIQVLLVLINLNHQYVCLIHKIFLRECSSFSISSKI